MFLSTKTSSIAPRAPKPVIRFPQGTLFVVTGPPERIYCMNTSFLKLIRNGDATYPTSGPLVGRDCRRFTDLVQRVGAGGRIRIINWEVPEESLRSLASTFGVWENGELIVGA